MSWADLNRIRGEKSKEAQTKICAACGIDKPKSEYHKLTGKSSGVQSKCKECTSEYKKKRYWANHEVELAKMTASRLKPENVIQRKGYYHNNKEDYKGRYLKYMQDPKKKKQKKIIGAEYEKNNADKIRVRKRRDTQREEVKIRKKKIHQIRQKGDIQYVIKRRLRCRLRHEIKRIGYKKFNKTYSTFDLVGCDFNKLKKHIESKFIDGMCWDRLSEIHIDHIKPCSKFDLTKIEEQKICFHYTNLQPLWKVDNLKKNNIYPYKIAS